MKNRSFFIWKKWPLFSKNLRATCAQEKLRATCAQESCAQLARKFWAIFLRALACKGAHLRARSLRVSCAQVFSCAQDFSCAQVFSCAQLARNFLRLFSFFLRATFFLARKLLNITAPNTNPNSDQNPGSNLLSATKSFEKSYRFFFCVIF